MCSAPPPVRVLLFSIHSGFIIWALCVCILASAGIIRSFVMCWFAGKRATMLGGDCGWLRFSAASVRETTRRNASASTRLFTTIRASVSQFFYSILCVCIYIFLFRSVSSFTASFDCCDCWCSCWVSFVFVWLPPLYLHADSLSLSAASHARFAVLLPPRRKKRARTFKIKAFSSHTLSLLSRMMQHNFIQYTLLRTHHRIYYGPHSCWMSYFRRWIVLFFPNSNISTSRNDSVIFIRGDALGEIHKSRICMFIKLSFSSAN